MFDEPLMSSPVAMPQSPQYQRALNHMGLTTDWIGGVLVQSRRVPVIGDLHLVSYGLCGFAGWAKARQRDFLSSCPKGPLFLNPSEPMSGSLSALGFIPLMTPAHVAQLRLRSTEKMRTRLNQKWRNRLNRALETGQTVINTRLIDAPDHWVFSAERAQQQAKGYRALPLGFAHAYAAANPDDAWIVTARKDGSDTAAFVILTHGQSATYHIGVSRPGARDLFSHHLLLWHVMTWLAGLGHRRLDLGVINTQDAPGLARFKLGTGATCHRLGGTWVRLRGLGPLARRLPARLLP